MDAQDSETMLSILRDTPSCDISPHTDRPGGASKFASSSPILAGTTSDINQVSAIPDLTDDASSSPMLSSTTSDITQVSTEPDLTVIDPIPIFYEHLSTLPGASAAGSELNQ